MSGAIAGAEVHWTRRCGWVQLVGASRPPLWFASAFAYSFGVASEATVKETTFWWGLLYCTFPFNLMLCGLNDVADWDVDHVNPKRNSAWRRCVDESQLGSLAFWSLALQVPCFLWILGNADKGTWHATAWVVSAGLQVSLYNGFCGLPQTSRISLMDLPMNVWAWLLPVHFAWLMHDAVAVRWQLVVFWALQLLSGQIFAAIHDIRSDLKGGKYTTATMLGKGPSVLLATSFWVSQSICGAAFDLVPMVTAAMHAALGASIASGHVHLKYAYPAGFLFDIALLQHTFPESTTVPAKQLIVAVSISAISLSVLANPKDIKQASHDIISAALPSSAPPPISHPSPEEMPLAAQKGTVQEKARTAPAC